MLSRIARVPFFQKPSLIYRVVSTSANKSNASAGTPPATSEHRRYPHDAPERDFVNFPPLRMPEEPGKIRIGLVPDEWFKAMYDKTGVTGPYILFWGLVTTIFSKEYFIYWVDSAHHLLFLAGVIFISKKFGPKLACFLDKKVEEHTEEAKSQFANASKSIDAKIKENESLSGLPEANQLICAAKRENVQLQMESAFRQRLATAYQEVKKRLDYQVSIQNVYKRLEKEQAIRYIIGEVRKSIGPAQEKEAFQSGLNHLKALAQKHAGTI